MYYKIVGHIYLVYQPNQIQKNNQSNNYYPFEKDCVKMVSVNSIELPFAVLKEMVDELDVRESIPTIYVSILLICFVCIVLIGRLSFTLSNLNARV